MIVDWLDEEWLATPEVKGKDEFDSLPGMSERSNRSSSDSNLNDVPRRRPSDERLVNNFPERLRTFRVLDLAGFIALPFQEVKNENCMLLLRSSTPQMLVNFRASLRARTFDRGPIPRFRASGSPPRSETGERNSRSRPITAATRVALDPISSSQTRQDKGQ